MKDIPVYVIRGGSSRGIVAAAKTLPSGIGIDQIALDLTGRGVIPVDGLGGGTPTTSKFVLIGNVENNRDKITIEYQVANLSPGTSIVDWSGTCGNMTSAVPLYALEEGYIAQHDTRAIELVNLSTNGRIMVDNLTPAGVEGYRMITRYLDPAGAVYGRLLPTKVPANQTVYQGQEYNWSLIDVTHPYLFIRRNDIATHNEPLSDNELALIERLRAAVALETGRVKTLDEAASLSGSVPRVVLVSPGEGHADVAVTAISMGKEIASVPVTSALCIAAAAGVPGSVVRDILPLYSGSGPINVVTKQFVVTATPSFDQEGQLEAASVARTARVLMKGAARLQSPS